MGTVGARRVGTSVDVTPIAQRHDLASSGATCFIALHMSFQTKVAPVRSF